MFINVISDRSLNFTSKYRCFTYIQPSVLPGVRVCSDLLVITCWISYRSSAIDHCSSSMPFHPLLFPADDEIRHRIREIRHRIRMIFSLRKASVFCQLLFYTYAMNNDLKEGLIEKMETLEVREFLFCMKGFNVFYIFKNSCRSITTFMKDLTFIFLNPFD
jgi:hypothetical protein